MIHYSNWYLCTRLILDLRMIAFGQVSRICHYALFSVVLEGYVARSTKMYRARIASNFRFGLMGHNG